jgi:hypothetical protein
MYGPVMLFSLLIAVSWAWSLFPHPQTRCTRCTGAAPHLRPLHTRTTGTCPKCGETGTRERPGIAALRTLGWNIGPTGRLRRRGAPTAGTDRRPGQQPLAR